ncbi:putative porin [Pseudoduganella flava]|uniref:Putative porin n=1 Tax=Pseudoduganella flava TaxID=871742 RepID=A0A562PKC4_9BURK|nr:porin [Pseudoduganella flava]TWI44884.1 putative porin [Pseudoduganella flava]
MSKHIKHAVTAALALAGAGAAQAQSQVQLYGIVDAGVVAEYGTPGGTTTAVSGGIASGSRLGLKGKEDLGDGLAAVFVLESGFASDTGTSSHGGRLFGRQAWVGLTGPFGGISAGRQYSPYYKALGDMADPFEDGFAGQAMNIIAGNRRMDNSVAYRTPVLAGWSAEVAYGAGEVAGDATRNRELSGSLTWAPGPLIVILTHHRREDPLLADHASNSAVVLRYTYGPLIGHAAFVRNRGPAGADSRDGLLGLTYKAGPHRVLVSVVQRDDRTAARRDARQVGIGYLYALSRRTDLYTAYGHIDNDNGASYKVGNATDDGAGNAAFNLGIRHTF